MPNNNYEDKYSGAPYNFVPFAAFTYAPVQKDEMEIHDIVSDSLLTGEISFTMKSKTPILIDDGNGDFFMNEYGELAIPGSSMRGLIRSNVQILSASSMDSDIDDYRIMYRSVADSANKGRYDTLLDLRTVTVGHGRVGVLKNVHAGYICKKNGDYVIYDTVLDKVSDDLGKMNYYVLSERYISQNLVDFPFYTKHPEYFQHDLKAGFHREEKKGRTHYVGNRKNNQYKPGYYPVSYEVKNVRHISKLGAPGVFSKEGYMVSTGPMNEKKAVYIIPKIDQKKAPIFLDKRDVDFFNIDLNKKKNGMRDWLSFFSLPEGNEIKPIFYVSLHDEKKNRMNTYFGFTPRLRVFYDYSIKDGYLQKQAKQGTYDYATSLFGKSDDEEGYKSKVSFTDFIAQSRQDCQERQLVLAEPKPSSYMDYLNQSKKSVQTYNSDGFELRGMKQFWLRDHVIDGLTNQKNDKVGSAIRPIENVEFTGKIRFSNLTKAELGLLLWAVRLEQGSYMNLGKGKPYGYGVVEVSNITANVIDNTKAYALDADLTFKPFAAIDVDAYIVEYKETKVSGDTKVSEMPSVKTFLTMKDPQNMPSEKQIRYMIIGEYQSRRKPLQTVAELTEAKKGNASGIVKFKGLNNKGMRYGFITCNNEEFYFNERDVIGTIDNILAGQKVTFTKSVGYDGKPKAIRVKPN